MELFGFEPIPDEVLARIPVPTSLIWGRHDSIVPLSIGEDASTRFGWPLRVIEDAGNEPAIEATQAFLRALLDDRTPRRKGAHSENSDATTRLGAGGGLSARRRTDHARGRRRCGHRPRRRGDRVGRADAGNRVAGAGPGHPGAIGGDHARSGVRSGQCDHPRLRAVSGRRDSAAACVAGGGGHRCRASCARHPASRPGREPRRPPQGVARGGA